MIRMTKIMMMAPFKLLWYETQYEESPTSVFKRLNSGKIPLTNAELIKALFLNSANFSNVKEEQTENSSFKNRIYLRQLEIANAWDKIEYTLHDDEFWLFLHDDSYTNPTRIDFIFDLIKENDYLGVKEKCFKNNGQLYLATIGQDRYQTFRYFERFLTASNLQDKENKIDECWKEVKSIFDVFTEWYKDIELFHYIGYLNCFGNKTSDIYMLWKESKDRNDFMNKLKNCIVKKISECKNLDEQYSYSESSEKHPDKTKVRPLLLLHNIQTVINQNKDFKNKSEYSLTLYYKFPFHLFKRETWNIEHIYPETTNTIEDESEQKEWLLSVYNSNDNSKVDDNLKNQIRNFLSRDFSDKDDERNKEFRDIYDKYYNDISESSQDQLLSEIEDASKQKEWLLSVYNSKIDKELKNQIKNFLSRDFSDKDGERNKDFRDIYDKYYNDISESFQDPLLSESERNKIWNFVLLDEHTNKSYGNAIFSVKRRIVIGKDQGEKWDYNPETFTLERAEIKDKEKYSAFVPVCTKNAFMKFYTPYPNDLTEWTRDDAKNYWKNIETVLKEFLDIKGE
ncbi:MAG: hypothetical protein HDR38_00115 [Treponema sp.]|nr:hypothetical protein [Treponema sp.]